MLTLSDQSGYGSYGTPSSYATDTQSTAERNRFKELIEKAEKAPLLAIFKHYKVAIDEYSRKTFCPFPKHKGGRENTPSFWFYPDNNTFWCFGCKTGRSAVDFVANREDISRFKAAQLVLEITVDEEEVDDVIFINQFDRAKLLMEFASAIRVKNSANIGNEYQLSCIEKIANVFDQMNSKHKLSNTALRMLMERLLV
jgi:hypothetical protein